MMQSVSTSKRWTLRQIWIYPIKSLPGVLVNQSQILPAGNLQHDREFALFDQDHRYINGKRTPAIHLIQTEWNLTEWSVGLSTLARPEQQEKFHLDRGRRGLEKWLSEQLGMAVFMEQQPVGGFPDDHDASGPTIISAATLQTVANWFPGLPPDEVQRRFRANLIIEGEGPFSEDFLFAGPNEMPPFSIGNATLYGSNPCQRCVVPTRDSRSAEAWPQFQKIFAEQRRLTLPEGIELSRFNHFYRLAVNTCIRTSYAQSVQTGDVVQIDLGPTARVGSK